MLRGKILKALVKRCRKVNKGMLPSSVECDNCCQWAFRWALSFMHNEKKESCIPRDVPKGHLVVYVGENQRRFVIKVELLKHPLFGALLDEAREEYEFTDDSRFYIPCNEDTFLAVVRCAMTPRNRRLMLCF
uniref:auxin-responsive protein SAUR50-like n=1 Tax=Erigeron canadensis TaxID=72917 RepID=UPI001CB89A74|nr:auxin-responsive protein SAUR50-like [Erigeron canadensis]